MKKKKRILLAIFSLLFIVVFISIAFKYIDNTEKNYPKTSGLTPDVDPKDDNILNLGGFGILFDKYSGEYLSSEVAKKLESLTLDVMPKMYEETKKLDKEGINDYYQKNKETIIKDFGINDVEAFEQFVQELNLKNQDLNTAYRLDLVKDTFENTSKKGGYSYIEYEVSFKNDNVIRFSVYIAKRKEQIPMLILGIK